MMIFVQSFAQTIAAKSTVVHMYKTDTIVVTLPKTQNTKIPKIWKNKKSIQKEWIHIEKDFKGYLNYDPCDGEAEQIYITENYIRIEWAMEEPEKFKILKFNFANGSRIFTFTAINKEYRNQIQGSAQILDSEKGVVLWEINGFRWLTVPIANIDQYRKIENICVNNKVVELEFLPIQNYK